MTLSDEEVDVLAVAETYPGFEGAWRLSAPPFPLAPDETAYRIALAVRDEVMGGRAYTLAALTRLPGARNVLVFDPSVGTPTPLRRAVPIVLSAFDRARAAARRDARAREERRILEAVWEPVPDPFPSRRAPPTAPSPEPPPIARIHADLTPCPAQPGRCALVVRDVRGPALVRPRVRVLLVDDEATLALPLRHTLASSVRVLHVRSRWEALERLEYQPFDRIVVVDRASTQGEAPSLNRFYRAAITIWPHLAPRFLFAVDDERQAAMRGRAGIGDRFIRRDLRSVSAALELAPAP